ncbi:hypothetical protein [Clostridium sp. AM42-4]|uniref:portal protein n=1 Tax=Clostridium sp. AM42-4 TaxID=2292305 RepID=UPI000E490D26|nr:hypothetical protein [Clostridium sp. AM42-4]RHS85496.1 hypothetical protein DW922_11550 [Clostridium sp. AM42-4]
MEEGRKVGPEQVRKAYETYKKYRSGLEAFQQRVINAEEWWKNNHWERFQGGDKDTDLKPVSAWLFNSLINKHADFIDNYPCPAILPREASDEETAKLLSEVVPVILKNNGFAKTYNANCWDKPKIGTSVYAVMWNPSKENGLGDIEVSNVDVLNITWQPGIEDVQKSRNIFVTEVVDADLLKEQYPDVADQITAGNLADRPKYLYEENMDTTDKVMVFDWYYKHVFRTESGGSRTILHYCKFANDIVLYASEDDPEYAMDGWYNHGKYPFVFDVQFPEKGSPAGFGYLDVMVNPQEYIDRLDQVIMMNALANKARFFSLNAANINEEEFTDLSKDLVHVSGNDVSEQTIRQIEPPVIGDIVFKQRDAKVNELKETSGNRDFSQGSTSSGVTAASAIAALQEAGSKLSRDMIKGSYTAYQEIVELTVELIRQFYDLPRCYRITKENGAAEYVQLTNQGLKDQAMPGIGDDLSIRRPVFDIKISAQKASPYSRIAQNELAKELYGLGVFNPQMADQALCMLRMMDFDRRDEVIQMIERNGTMYQQMQQMQGTMMQMAALIAKTTGDTSIMQTLQEQGVPGPDMTAINTDAGQQIKTDSLGRAMNTDNSTQGKARQRVSSATEVQS